MNLLQDDCAIVIATFGLSGLNASAAKIAHKKLYSQRYLPQVYWYNLELPNSPKFTIPQDDRTTFVNIVGTELNEFLFQKECLYNIAFNELRSRYSRFLFLDSDVFSDSDSWIQAFDQLVSESPSTIVQGFEVCLDTDPSGPYSQSLISYYVDGLLTDLPLNPGLCIGMQRETFISLGGFPTRLFEGSDDVLLLAEQLKFHGHKPYGRMFEIYSNYFSKATPQFRLKSLPFKVRHQFHGSERSRMYSERAEILKGADSGSVTVNRETGLREWTQPESELKRDMTSFLTKSRGVLT